MPNSCIADEGGPPSDRSVLQPFRPGASVRGSTASAGAPVKYRPWGSASRSWGRSQNTRRRKVPEEREGFTAGANRASASRPARCNDCQVSKETVYALQCPSGQEAARWRCRG